MSDPYVVGQRGAYPLVPPSGESPDGGSAGMAHPNYNPAGGLPGQAVPRPVELFSRKYGQRWVFDADASKWRWTVPLPLFDLRPGAGPSNGPAGGKVNPYPINHEAALGLSIYANIQFFPTSAAATPPAGVPLIECDCWEEGNVSTPDDVYMLGRVIDVTTTLLAGGLTVGSVLGASVISFTTSATAIRFWRPVVRINIPGLAGAPPSTSLGAWASLH